MFEVYTWIHLATITEPLPRLAKRCLSWHDIFSKILLLTAEVNVTPPCLLVFPRRRHAGGGAPAARETLVIWTCNWKHVQAASEITHYWWWSGSIMASFLLWLWSTRCAKPHHPSSFNKWVAGRVLGFSAKAGKSFKISFWCWINDADTWNAQNQGSSVTLSLLSV